MAAIYNDPPPLPATLVQQWFPPHKPSPLYTEPFKSMGICVLKAIIGGNIIEILKYT
jgi:hypothetical protein